MATKAPKTNNTYFNVVVDNKNKPHFGIYHKEASEGLEQIETFDKDGKTKGVKFYDLYSVIEGKIKNVGIYDKDTSTSGKFEVLTVSVENSEGVTEIVSVSFQSQFAQSFIKCIESVDKEKNVQLAVFRIKDEEKSTAKGKEIFNDYFCIYQFDEAQNKWVTVKSKYKFIADINDPNLNANPNKLPDFVKTTVKEKGKNVDKYDTANFDEALRDIVKNINPDFKTAYEASKKVENTTTEKLEQAVDNNDLPF